MTTPNLEPDVLNSIVGRVFAIHEVTWGDERLGYVVRYRGELYIDSVEAYDWLADALRPHSLTPLFRMEGGRQTVILVSGVIKPKPSNPWVNAILFAVTLISVLLTGAAYVYDGAEPSSSLEMYKVLFANLASGLPFALSLLAILVSHEFGHYLAGRYHKTAVTLPYFLPLPIPTTFGTLGAFIQLKEPPKNKRVLLDIGIAGPLAGLVIAIPIVIYGLMHSSVGALPTTLGPGESVSMEGNSILYLALKYLVTGQVLPTPVSYGNLPPLLYWVRYFFTGTPFPFGGMDIHLGPIAWAGWAGLLVTALNLIPAGQLDGGHTLYVLLGRGARRLLPFILGALFLLGLVWSGWWLWVFLVLFLGRTYAEPLDQITRLDPQRKFLAVLTLVIFFLVFTPVPLSLVFNQGGALFGF